MPSSGGTATPYLWVVMTGTEVGGTRFGRSPTSPRVRHTLVVADRSMVNRRTFLTSTAAAAGAAAAPARKPNILLVLMDDFGIGHFAPHAETLRTRDFDQAYVQFLERRAAGYAPEQALDLARRAMPTIGGLAKTGAVFTNACTPNSLCAPARCGIFTGNAPSRYGIYNNIDFNRAGLPHDSMLVRRLRDAGYATALIGKYHTGMRDEALRRGVLAKHGVKPGDWPRLTRERRAEIDKETMPTGFIGSVVEEHNPLHYGFDYYFGYNHYECPFYDNWNIWENRTFTGLQKRYNTELFADKAIGFARKAIAENKPFFVHLAMHAVHGPLKPQAPARYFEQFPSPSYDLSNFFAHVNAVDHAIAAVRNSIGEQEWRNTLLMFTSDNGAPVSLGTPLPGNAPHRGHKGNYHLGGIRVPLLLHWPEGIRPSRPAALVSSMDLMHTAVEAAGLAPDNRRDGRSLLAVANGKARKAHDSLFWAGIHARSWGYTGETTIGPIEPRREESPGAWAVSDGAYLLRFTGAIIPGLFKDAPDGAPARFELYDLREDPVESRDLSTQLPQVVKRLREQFAAEARTLPAPPVWRRDRWQELMSAAGR